MSDYGARCAGCGSGPAYWNDRVGEMQCANRRVGACPLLPAPAPGRDTSGGTDAA